jgi:NAD(P)-dependent dehydrogenase (short-subunit alcohol dehydrogenase family)
MDIRDRIVVVTGGGNGIGKALCEAFARRRGAKAVIAADLDAAAAEAVAAVIGGEGHGLDVRDEGAVKALVEDVEGRHGRIDLFCSNAGIIAGDGEPWYATSAPNATWQAMWEIHVMAHVYAARACLPGNDRARRGLLPQHGVRRRPAQPGGRRGLLDNQARGHRLCGGAGHHPWR